MKSKTIAVTMALNLTILLAACGGGDETAEKPADAAEQKESGTAVHADEGKVVLSAQQIAAAGIQVAPALLGGYGSIELPATIEGDPQATQVVSAAIGGRVVVLNRNLGQSVGRGETLAIIESREAAQIKGEVEASRARLALARSNLAREERLFRERVSPEQDLIAARTAATEARIALQQAQQQVAAAGGGGGALNRIGITAPISGQVIARSIVLGQTVAADAELYRVADLKNVSLSFNLPPADAGRIKPGSVVMVTAPGRQASARISFVSPALDPQTKQVPVIATLDNRARQWRVGEPVTASIQFAGSDDGTFRVPSGAVQTVEGTTVVFVRIRDGFQATEVTTGDISGGSVIVRSGLKGGERIATVNSFTLKAELGKGEDEHGGH